MNQSNFDEIKRLVEEDIKPVRPIIEPWKAALSVVALWCPVVALVLAFLGLRSDHTQLGTVGTWGFAFIQLLVAYLIATVGIRLTIPASNLPMIVLSLAVFSGAVTHLAISGITFHLSPRGLEPAQFGKVSLVCFLVTFLLGLLPSILLLIFASRGLPIRPLVTGLLCGLGSGLSAEAAWRLHCPYSSPDHVLLAHTGAVISVMLLGSVAGFFWQRRMNDRF